MRRVLARFTQPAPEATSADALLLDGAWMRYCITQALARLKPHTADPWSFQPHIATDVEALQAAVGFLERAVTERDAVPGQDAADTLGSGGGQDSSVAQGSVFTRRRQGRKP